ncbi:hypothetical protein Agabi119p4_8385 [Agaricus bisporus var. burnettii]|uniref:Nephrocystin 3-like N-terminal domain-containing protein n=1 Tax=Agaricus bisporus var. burnettii TaxID=192524 RepID=A0A8H7C5R2_AGABI|nr:hypothetical protein Agabi119p4_8385 [Agaricus bisporus var. burnettii]
MPATSSHWPPLSQLSPVDPSNDTTIFLPPCFDPSPEGRLRVPVNDVNSIATSTIRSSCTPGNPIDQPIDYRSSTGRFRVGRGVQILRPPGFVAPWPPGSNHTGFGQVQRPLAPPRAPYPLATYSQQYGNPEPLIVSLPSAFQLRINTLKRSGSEQPPRLQQQSPAMFNQAHNFTVMGGTFIAGNVTHNNLTSSQFMEKLLEKTIPGAEFDSSARDPPPRCHPGTRLAILEQCLSFVRNCEDNKKMRWVVGAAGVGKSAVVQSVVESPELAVSCHASVFFSINGRDDGTKAILTISYQFAAKCEPYRQLVEREITRDPSILRSSVAKQFRKLIIDPFIHNPQLISAGRVLIAIDGLDECNNYRMQLELLRLISDLCINYPSSPLVWLIASRPEQHIASFFSQPDVAPVYEKEEMVVDSYEARADVERFLRDGLTEIKNRSDSVDSRWPEEQDLWKLANASGGLFAYADTVVRYIGGVNVGSPASQLSEVLKDINNHSMTDIPRADHPMASLDALYARILSNVPSKVMTNARKIILALAANHGTYSPPGVQTSYSAFTFVLLCNWLGMTPDEAYAAINHLRAVLRVPKRDDAGRKRLEFFHKSFTDYVYDFRRSGFSPDIRNEARQLMAQCAFRILNEAPDGIDYGDVDYGWLGGTIRRVLVLVPRFWLLGHLMKILAALTIDPTYPSELFIQLATSRFESFGLFPLHSLRDLAFSGSRRQLKQIPLKPVYTSDSFDEIKMQFRRPAMPVVNTSNPWNSRCGHKREGQWKGGNVQDWITTFQLKNCHFCKKRLQGELEKWRMRSPDYLVPTLFTSTGLCCVEFRVIGSDGISEWTYWLWCHLSARRRKKYGSTV